MKVAHVITRMIVGGAQENTLYSVQGLAALPGYEVSLLTGPETGSEGNLLAGIGGDLDIRVVPHLVRAIHPVSDARAFAELYGAFRAMRPDIVHTHSSKAGVVGRAAARAARVPVVVHTLHSLVFHDYQAAPVNFAYRSLKRMLSPLTDHYVSVSDNIRERAVAAKIGTADRHSTVRSGFFTDDFVAQLVPQAEARRKLDLPEDRLIVGVVARLFPLKGHAEILEAASRLVENQPDVLFAFVGSGPLLAELQRDVEARGLGHNVRFVGRIDPSEITLAFSAFDVLAHCSLREGLARVLPQGALAGLPIVCYDLDGSAEVVRDGVNGFLVDPKDHQTFADRLERLLREPALRAQMADAAPQRIQVEYSVAEMVRRLDALYQQLAADGEASGQPKPARRSR